MKIYTADEIRRVEEYEDRVGTEFIRLMENAGSACSMSIQSIMRASRMLDDALPDGVKICIVCGKGKNGGDGFVIARKLLEKGYAVKAVLAQGAPTAPDAVEMYTKASAIGVKIIRYDREQSAAERAVLDADIVVDCIFGIGFHGVPDPVCTEVFELINASLGKVVSVDVPSGVNTDTGEVEGVCVSADFTLAISAFKPAHALLPARLFCGKTELLDIGISNEAMESTQTRLLTYDYSELESLIPTRAATAHKNDFGHVLCVCGSRKMPGAARLASMGALVNGAGLVTVAFPKSAYPSLAAGSPEVMLLPLSENEDGTVSDTSLPELLSFAKKASVLVIGCGLGQGKGVSAVVQSLIQNAECPIVLDADGLNAVCENVEILKEAKSRIIITPHPGEFSRLCKTSVSEISADRIGIASRFAKEYGTVVLLKGAATVVASPDNDAVYINRSGNSGLAKGGSGDVLSGIISGFAAQGINLFSAACMGAYVHGLSAELASKEFSKHAMTASDIFFGLRKLYSDIEK